MLFLSFKSGYPDREFSEVSVIQMLTGWMPEVIDVKYVALAHRYSLHFVPFRTS